ncbi:MAG TPA: VCBS repeat-containing protein [Vicinamibacterales bacterium]|nr:VCBS repeat-containing protein [Vicinamibacterales bacterium]
MRVRALVLSSLIAAATMTLGFAGPPVLTPAEGPPIRIGRPNNIAIGDVNNDGHPDLVVATQASTVTIFLGRGNGQFTPALPGAIKVPAPPDELAVGDLNGDTNLDLALGNHDSYGVTLLSGDGRGGFRLAPSSPVVMKEGRQPHTHGLAIADFNRDGKSDLASVNSNDDNDVAVMLGDGNGRFTRAPGSPFSVGQAPYPLAVGDLDNDGAMDAVVTITGLGAPASTPSNLLTVLFGDGRGGFRRQDVTLRTKSTWFVAIADVNGDRNLDLAATHGSSSLVSVVLGDGRGGFTEAQGSPLDLGHNAFSIGIADLNRDGRSDVLAAADEGVRVMLNNGRGGFVTAPGSPFATGKGSWRLAVADVNSDGKLDVATSNLETDSVTVLLGR